MYIVKISKANPSKNHSTRVSIPSQIVEQIKLLECDYVEISTDGEKITLTPIRKS